MLAAGKNIAAASTNRIVAFICMLKLLPRWYRRTEPVREPYAIGHPAVESDRSESSAIRPQIGLFARLFAPHLLLPQGLQILLLVSRPGESIGKRRSHHRSLISRHQRFGLLLLGSDREPLCNQLHRASDGNAHFAAERSIQL